jgi:hypothetical protein
MPRLRKTVLVSLVFIAGCVASQAVTRFAVPTARAATDQHWDYSCREVWGNRTGQIADEMTSTASAYGARGWQLSTVFPFHPEHSAIACFERSVP